MSRRCPMSDVRVLIVDDQEPFRLAMAAVVEETDGFEVGGFAVTGEESLTAVSELRPDLVLMDIHLPGIDGIEARDPGRSGGGRAVEERQ
jgi:DNA-binding NarL/FixJ family response regulator